jgi:hypothetical protein
MLVVVFGVVMILVATPLAAHQSVILLITQTPPFFVSLNGDRITTVNVGQQIMVSTSFAYPYQEGGDQKSQVPFVGFIEVRNENGVTQSLSYQSTVIDLRSNLTMGASWVPEESATHVARVFAVRSLANAEVLTPVDESYIDVK